MAFLLTLKQLWPTIKADVIRLFYFIKNNDIAKLFILSGVVGKCHSNLWLSTQFMTISLETLIEASLFLLFSILFLYYFFSFLYYSSFNVKKTEYTLPRILYFFTGSLVLLHTVSSLSQIDNPVAVTSFKFLYSVTFLIIIANLRLIVIQQYNNVQNSIFKKIQNHTGLVVVLSTPQLYFQKRMNVNHYMLGFNTNITTWLTLGIFVIMEQEGLYLKKVFITYNEILMFNETFNKKITQYTEDELNTTIMYSI